jgi:hypothetical protein
LELRLSRLVSAPRLVLIASISVVLERAFGGVFFREMPGLLTEPAGLKARRYTGRRMEAAGRVGTLIATGS